MNAVENLSPKRLYTLIDTLANPSFKGKLKVSSRKTRETINVSTIAVIHYFS